MWLSMPGTLFGQRHKFSSVIGPESVVFVHPISKAGEQITELKRHVADQEVADIASEAEAIRLATDFHVLLAGMTGRPILERYVTEVAYRSGLALSAYGRPHSNDCAIEEHRKIVEALEKGDADAAAREMTGHLSAVADRAQVMTREAPPRDLATILAPFVTS